MTERIGEHLGNYRLVRLLGSGGFAGVIAVTGVKCDLQKDIMCWRKRYIEQTPTG